MKSIRRILFAIRDPAASRQPGLAKALALAEAFDARLELFHALCSPVFVNLQPYGDLASVADLEKNLLARAQQRLETIAEADHRRGVEISCTAT